MTGDAARHEQTPFWRAPRASGAVDASVSLPGSKSQTNRALVLAALAEGPGVVARALRSRDTGLMVDALKALGARIDDAGGDWSVHPGPLEGGVPVDCGLAGTVMRFVPPVAALAEGRVAFDGDAHARTRPMSPLLAALRSVGVQIDDGGRGSLPFVVHGAGRVRGGSVTLDASSSSQFVSALLLAGAAYDVGLEVTHDGPPLPSMPHIAMTVEAMANRGIDIVADGNRWTVSPGPVRASDVVIEPDLSNAAPFLAIGAVTGGTVTVADWPRATTQAGDAMREILTALGAGVERTPAGLTVTGGELHGIDWDLREVGELTPAVAALCALASTPSRLHGVGHIRGHETDRLAALARELNALGGRVSETDDGLRIKPAPLHGGVFRTYGDHRMAHAGAIVGLAVDGVLVEDIETTAKTFPGFAEAWLRAVRGARG